jgi:hypothetical protein
MAIYDPRYEVAWQLSEDDNDGSLVDVNGADRASRENYASLARFAGLLAGAEVAAVTLCRGEGLIIEFTDPPSPWLSRGSFMRAQPSNSADDEWSVDSLLTGSVRWCWCKPPTGFYSAALIGGPALVASQRLLLVANRECRLSEVNLGLAASYLAQARRLAPGAIADQAGRAAGADVDQHEGGSPRRNQGSGRGALSGAGSGGESSARPAPGSVAGSVRGSEQATESTPPRREEPES